MWELVCANSECVCVCVGGGGDLHVLWFARVLGVIAIMLLESLREQCCRQ